MGDKTPAQQSQTSQTSPWANAVPMLNSAIAKYMPQNTDVTGNQQTALDSLWASAGMIPNFGEAGAGQVSKLFNSDPSVINTQLTGNLDALTGRLGGIADGSELDPYKTPGFGTALSSTMDNITNRVKSVYAGSGRDPSGAGSFAGTLGKGLMEGAAPMLTSQFNTNNTNRMNAANTLYGAGNTTAQGQWGNQQTALSNGMQGMAGAGMLANLFNQPANAALDAANKAQNMPFQNLSPYLQAALGLGGMGGSSNGTSTSQAANDPLSNILGAGMMGASMFFSDENMKSDIKKVGMLDDGNPVIKFRYKGEPKGTEHVGLSAQETLKRTPEAVHKIGGRLAVNYPLALAKAGMLHERKAA